MCARGEQIILAPYFKNLAHKPSGPVALRMDRFPIRFKMSSSFTDEKLKAVGFTP